MTEDGQSFGEKVGNVYGPRNEEHAELSLLNPVSQPMEAHVERFRHLQRDAAIGQTDSDFVVAKYWRRRLRVSHVVKYLSLVRRDARGGESAGVLCFGDERADNRDACGVGRYRVIERSGVGQVAEKVRAAGDTSGRRAGEVGGVREATKNHFGRSVDFSSVGVGGGVAEETVETGHGFGGGVRLLGRKCAGSGQEAGIYGTTIV